MHRAKRGLSSKKGFAMDVDWIISLGIFLIYLGIFFLTIRQIPGNQSPADLLLDNVADGIIAKASWTVQKLPLFITSNVSGTEPIIVLFNYGWKNFTFRDNTTFELKDEKLIFIRNFRQGKNIVELASSAENYTTPNVVYDLTASPVLASVNSQRFVSEFSNSLLKRANHFDKERLDEFNISISGANLRPENEVTEANISALSAKYKIIFPQLNHTSFIVGGYSRIYNYISTGAKESHDVSIGVTLRNYSYFLLNELPSSTINYTTGKCSNKLGRFVDFYDEVSGVSLIFPDNSNITFCPGDGTVRLNVQFALSTEAQYDILFHSGDYNNTLKYISPFKTKFGIVENLTGISKSLFQTLNGSSYAGLKRNFSYPSTRDFSFTLTNESGAVTFNYATKKPGTTDVFAKEVDVSILDKYGIKTKQKLRVNGW